jgi:hypothetical protein
VNTYLLAPAGKQKLDNLAQVTTFKKVPIAKSDLEAMDAFLARDPAAFEEYAINGCRVALEYYLRFTQAHEAMFGQSPKIPLTLGGVTEQAYLSWLDRHLILTRALVLGEETRKVINKREWESKATVNVSTRRFTEALASTAYMGGLSQTYVHGQTCVEPDEVILDLDFAGAYPAAMAVLPVIDWTEPAAVVQDPAEIAATYRQGTCGDQDGVVPITCIECTFAFPLDCSYPGLPVPTQYGLVYPLRGETVCTGLEVALALAMGAQVTIKNGMRFPSFQDATGIPPLAFAGFLGELTRRRAQAPEDSLSNRLLKEMVNSFYGKLAQGITERQVYDFSGVSKPLQPSSITVPHYAAMTTGIGRAALAALVAEIGAYPGCRVLSATIDGAMIVIPRRFTLEVDSKGKVVPPASFAALYPDIYAVLMQSIPIQALEQGRLNMGLEPGSWLAIKHVGTEAWTFKTRGYVLQHAGVDQHTAWSGYQKKSGDEMIEIYRDPTTREVIVSQLTTMQDILDGKARDLVRVGACKAASLDYDY